MPKSTGRARQEAPIEFVLDGRPQAVDGRLATTTLLHYLREVLGKTGTKEGCATGECGACMVALAERGPAGVSYRAAHSCLRLLGTLHGRSVVTVEHLGSDGCAPHPVQQAMLHTQAAQCGFCTPGFVMSLFALGTSIASLTDDGIRYALSGNLCRCTGYRPIIEAAQRLRLIASDSATPRDSESEPETPLPIASVASSGFAAPTDLVELESALRRWPSAVLVAGGTDVVPRAAEGALWSGPLVYLGAIEALRRITIENDRIVVGAAAPLVEVFRTLLAEYPTLGELVRRFASLPIANVATLAGNVATASPVGDMIPVLISLGATLRLRRDGRNRRLPIEEFFIAHRKNALRPREFIEAIELPRHPSNVHVRAYKVAKRFEQDTSSVIGAFRITLESERIVDVRLAFGGMAATPLRMVRTERVMIGRAFDRATVDAACRELEREVEPVSDHRGSAAFRRRVAANLLVKWVLEVTEAESVSLWRSETTQ